MKNTIAIGDIVWFGGWSTDPRKGKVMEMERWSGYDVYTVLTGEGALVMIPDHHLAQTKNKLYKILAKNLKQSYEKKAENLKKAFDDEKESCEKN